MPKASHGLHVKTPSSVGGLLLRGAYQLKHRTFESYANCPVEAAVDLIGGKWKAVILSRLMEETRRFSELRRLMPNITPRMLTNQLRELEANGIVHRDVYAHVSRKSSIR